MTLGFHNIYSLNLTPPSMHTREELSRLTENYLSALPFPARPDTLYAPIRYSLQEGGKRLRPVLMLLAGEAFGGQAEDMLPAAAAVEVFHNFTLLHDDIMDNAALRRGKPTVHVRWGANTAILSGDAMLIYAYRLLAQSPAALLPGLLEQFNRMAAEVCEGQQYDMDFEQRTTVTEAEYMEMISLKTAALIARGAVMGTMMAGASKEDCDGIYRFGQELGLAFQLQDDLLDSYSDNPSFGKQVGGDIIEGKKSFLTLKALETSDQAKRSELTTLLTDPAMDPVRKVQRVREIYDSLGIRQMAEKEIASRIERSLKALEGLKASPEGLEALHRLATGMTGRHK